MSGGGLREAFRGSAIGRFIPEGWRFIPEGWVGEQWREGVRTIGAIGIAIIGATVLLSTYPWGEARGHRDPGAPWTVSVDAVWVPVDPPAVAVRDELGDGPLGDTPPSIDRERRHAGDPSLDGGRRIETEDERPERRRREILGMRPDDHDPGGAQAGFDEDPPPAPAATETYVVRRNDSLWKLAERAFGDGTRHPELLEINPSLRGKALHPGMKIILPVNGASGGGGARALPDPAPRKYVVRRGDTLSEIAARHRVTVDALFRANRARLRSPDRLEVGVELNVPSTARSSEGRGR